MHIILKFIVIGLLVISTLGFAQVPSTITLGGVVYRKANENVIGNDKRSQYIQSGETLTNWTSMVAVHFYMFAEDPITFAQQKAGTPSSIQPIDGNQNNILQTFDTMISIGHPGDPVTFQQNLWRLQQLNYGKGIMAIEYAQRKLLPSQSSPQGSIPIPESLKNEIKTLPIDTYSF